MRIRRKNKRTCVIAAPLIAIALFAFAPSLPAQQTGAAPQSPASAQQSPTQQPPSAQQSATPAPSAANSQDNRLIVNPVTGLVTASATHFVPLTSKQRWKVYWIQTYWSYGAYFKPTLFALVLDQAQGSPREWGGGFPGFGRREASRIGSNIVSGTIRTPLAAVLHEDVRYPYSGQHGPMRRILHATEFSFLTNTNQGHPTLNIAKLVSYYASTAIATTWHPPGHYGVAYTFENGSEQLGLSVPFNILQEFWPTIFHKSAHHK